MYVNVNNMKDEYILYSRLTICLAIYFTNLLCVKHNKLKTIILFVSVM